MSVFIVIFPDLPPNWCDNFDGGGMISESLKKMYQVIYYHQKKYGSKYQKKISRDFETLLSVLHRSSLVKALLSEYN